VYDLWGRNDLDIVRKSLALSTVRKHGSTR